MQVIKEEQGLGSAYYLIEGDTCLKIIYSDNLDLKWCIYNKNNSSRKSSYESMLITKENYTIYSLFESLIRETQQGRVYLPNEIELEPTFYDEFDICDIYDVDPFSLDEEDEISLTNHYRREESDKMNKMIKDSFAYQDLTQNNAITWRSDDGPIESANIVRITEVEEGILVEFIQPQLDTTKMDVPSSSSLKIRFANSGSRYGGLVNLFTRMYNRLTEYEPDYHQIHLEELEYQKRLLKEKKDN